MKIKLQKMKIFLPLLFFRIINRLEIFTNFGCYFKIEVINYKLKFLQTLLNLFISFFKSLNYDKL